MSTSGNNDIDLFELLDVLRARKAFIAAITVVLTGIGVFAILTMTPRYQSTATFLVRQAQSSNPLEPWNNLAEQFGYKIKPQTDPLLTNLERVLKTESFYAPFLDESLAPGNEDSSLVKLFKIDRVPEDKKLEALTGRITAAVKFKINSDKTYSIVVSTPGSHLSQFLANGLVDQLNAFFVAREKKEHDRKLDFLRIELANNRGELDSISNKVAGFLLANKEFTSPSLSYTYQKLKREETIYTEKYMITMKAFQSLNIAASQPEYFFEVLEFGKRSDYPAIPQKGKWIAGTFFLSFVVGCVFVLCFNWLLILKKKRPSS